MQAIIEATPTGETGTVASGWDLKITEDAIIIYNDEFGDIVKYLEEGTEPYTIRAKRGKSLAFMWPNAPFPATGKGGEHLLAKVEHPGIKARRFIEKVMNNRVLEKEWDDLFEKELEKLVISKIK